MIGERERDGEKTRREEKRERKLEERKKVRQRGREQKTERKPAEFVEVGLQEGAGAEGVRGGAADSEEAVGGVDHGDREERGSVAHGEEDLPRLGYDSYVTRRPHR